MFWVRLKAITISLLLVFIFAGNCLAKEIAFEIGAERKRVALGQGLELYLSFEGTQDIPAVQLPGIEGFQGRYVGPSTRMSVINGQVSSSITHVYTLFPLKTGVFNIGPLSFDYKGNTYKSNAISIEVIPANQGGGPSEGETEGASLAQDIRDRIFLVIQQQKTKAYLNEVVPVSIKLYVNRLGVRDIQYPSFEHEGFSVSGFGQPRQYRENLGGVTYEVIEFNTSVFGLRGGEFRLGPAKIDCNLVVKKERVRSGLGGLDDFFDSDVLEDFFGRYQTQGLKLDSPDIPITILPLPEEGRPRDFKGAVGDFDFEVNASPEEVKAGDPVTLKGIVKGKGNFSTVTIAGLDPQDGLKVYEPQIKQEDSQKNFEQVVIPLNEDLGQIPAMSFSFFNPESGRYQTIIRGPFPVKVLKAEKAEEPRIIEPAQALKKDAAAPEDENYGRDIVYIKEQPGRLIPKGRYLYNNRLFLGFQLLPVVCFIALYSLRSWSRRIKTDVRYARRLSAPRKARQGLGRCRENLSQNRQKEFYDVVFNTLREYLGDRFHLPSQGMTVSVIDETLKDANLPKTLLDKIEAIFRDCDMARYAGSELTRETMQATLKDLEEAIDYLQRH